MWAPVGLSILLLYLHQYFAQPPDPVAPGKNSSEFSTLLAQKQLRHILQDAVPHPMGSAANKEVKARIVETLNAYGLEVDEQQTFSCAKKHNSCGWVENIVARLQPLDKKHIRNPSVTLMSHYDSVPMSPGAGDNGAGVATLLEIARILTGERKNLNPVIFLFTDGEEFGLLGAEAYFSSHAWSKNTGYVLNLEGSGSSGNSNLLRTGPNNIRLINLYQKNVSHYAAMSLVSEIFKRMPNDTDFSVAQRAKLSGIDFAFAEDRNHYHTPLDTIENLSLNALAHHGDNLLALTKDLADSEFVNALPGDASFLSLFGSVLIVWHESKTLPLLLVALLLMSSIVLLTRSEYSLRKVMLGILSVICILVSVSIFNYVTFWMLAFLRGPIVNYPAHLWPYYLMIGGSTFLGGLLPLLILKRFSNYWSSTIGLWICWSALSCATTSYLPAAANMFIVPTLAALAILLVSRLPIFVGKEFNQVVTSSLVLLVVSLFTLALVPALIETQGLRLLMVNWLLLGLYMAAIAPLAQLVDVKALKVMTLAGGLLILSGAAASVSVPLYSEDKAQHINIHHVQTQDQEAWWILDSPNPIPARLLAVHPFEKSENSVLPWLRQNRGTIASAQPKAMPSPQLLVISDTSIDGGRQLELQFKSARGANYGTLLIPESARLKSLSLEGIPLATTISLRSRHLYSKGFHSIHMAAIPIEGIRIQLVSASPEPIEAVAIDWSSELPESAEELLGLRAPLGVPIHRGDQSLIFALINI